MTCDLQSSNIISDASEATELWPLLFFELCIECIPDIQ
jgi:hypothetical protein